MNAIIRRCLMREMMVMFLLGVCCFAATNASAHTPHAREVHAVIQSVDSQTQTLTLIYDQGAGTRKMIWNADARFLRDRKFVSAAELKEGTHATVYYQSPFIGKPFVTRVVWAKNN